MSATFYREPYKLPAGILAVAVHGFFFALLYFGFTWKTQPAATMSVELWSSLPDTAVALSELPEKVMQPLQQEVEPAVERQQETSVEPVIALPDRKKPEPVPEIKVKTMVAERLAVEHARIAEDERKARITELAAREKAEEAARARAEQAAAIGRIVDEYTGRIVSKIRRNIVMPPSVANDAQVEFSVTLLPGGTVLNARLTRFSGNVAYDNAVERAILKSQPLPLPSDATMFKNFRELKLVFRPVE